MSNLGGIILAISKNISILELMVKDHCKIEDLISNLEEKNKGDFETMKTAFQKFEWELEKHIFTEEKAIFTNYSPDDVTEGYKMLPELTKEHNFIVNKLNNWRDDIRHHRMLTDVYGFKEFLVNHRHFEEEKVYPRLDQSLSDEEKRHIVAKINEMI
jgi:hemerythrin superfamily protein